MCCSGFLNSRDLRLSYAPAQRRMESAGGSKSLRAIIRMPFSVRWLRYSENDSVVNRYPWVRASEPGSELRQKCFWILIDNRNIVIFPDHMGDSGVLFDDGNVRGSG